MNKTKVYNNVHIIIDTTYSHYYRCVYVVYPNMITIPGAICSLRTSLTAKIPLFLLTPI